MRVGENSERAGHVEVPTLGCGATRLLVDQELVGIQRLGERQGRSLTCIKEIERGIG